jgi:hypothetical protein
MRLSALYASIHYAICVLFIKMLLVLAGGHVMLCKCGHFLEKITYAKGKGPRMYCSESLDSFEHILCIFGNRKCHIEE